MMVRFPTCVGQFLKPHCDVAARLATTWNCSICKTPLIVIAIRGLEAITVYDGPTESSLPASRESRADAKSETKSSTLSVLGQLAVDTHPKAEMRRRRVGACRVVLL